MTEESGKGIGPAFRRFLTAVVILALAAAVVWLASERNSHHYFLQADGRRVTVGRGWFAPAGHGPFRPRDPALARAYQPFTLPEGVAGPAADGEEFDDRGELDRRLGALLLDSAKARLARGDPQRLARGIAYLDQAARLEQLSSDERGRLSSLRSEVAYFEAAGRIEAGLAALQEARRLLEQATAGDPAHARAAAELLDRLGPAFDGLLRATRGADLPPAAAPAAVSPSPVPPEARDGG